MTNSFTAILNNNPAITLPKNITIEESYNDNASNLSAIAIEKLGDGSSTFATSLSFSVVFPMIFLVFILILAAYLFYRREQMEGNTFTIRKKKKKTVKNLEKNEMVDLEYNKANAEDDSYTSHQKIFFDSNLNPHRFHNETMIIQRDIMSVGFKNDLSYNNAILECYSTTRDDGFVFEQVFEFKEKNVNGYFTEVVPEQTNNSTVSTNFSTSTIFNNTDHVANAEAKILSLPRLSLYPNSLQRLTNKSEVGSILSNSLKYKKRLSLSDEYFNGQNFQYFTDY
ncbi:hypothetical protein HK099_002096, partial [Clydaea vesicula]